MTIKNTTVLALLDRAEAAEAKVAAVRAVCDRFWPEELHDAVPRGVADSQSQIITRAIVRALDGTA